MKVHPMRKIRSVALVCLVFMALEMAACDHDIVAGESSACENISDDPAAGSSKQYESDTTVESVQWYEIDAADYDTTEYYFVNNIRCGVFTSEIASEDRTKLQQEDQNKDQDPIFAVVEDQKYVYLEDNLFESTVWMDGNPCRIAFYWCEYQGNICIAADMDDMVSGDYVWTVETVENQTNYVLASVSVKQSFEAAYFLCDLKENRMIDLNQQFLADAESAGLEGIDSVYEMLWNVDMSQAIVVCNKMDRILYWNRETHELSDMQDKLGDAEQFKLCWIAEDQVAVGILHDVGEKQEVDVYLFDTQDKEQQDKEWTQVISKEFYYRPLYTDAGIYFGQTVHALYFYWTGEVGLCDLSTGEKRTIDGVNVQDTVWKTDGVRAVFSDQNRKLLWLIDLQSGEVRHIA